MMRPQNSDFLITTFIYLAYFFIIGNCQNSFTTTTAPAISNTEIQNEPYYICGKEKLRGGVQCSCYDKRVSCITWLWQTQQLKNANIQVLISNFTVETAYFDGHKFGILKKNETLPKIAENIKSLYLNSAEITDIETGTFDKFDKLKILGLSSNYIKNLAADVLTQKLGTTLTELDLNDNHMLSLSAIDFTNMVNLKDLQLGFNDNVGKAFALPSWTFPKTLSNVKILYLGYCNISNIPENVFVNLIKLESLNLYNNPLTAYPKALNVISTLRYLDLSNTLISDLNQTSLGINEHLNTLLLPHARITSIGDCALCGFTNLTTLHLHYNRNLSFLHENAFGYAKNGITPKIESFSVEFCNLSIIPEKLLNWNSVKEFGVGGNPFNCTCEMAWLIDDIMNPTHTMNLKKVAYQYRETPLKCKSPIIYKDIELYRLSQKYCTKNHRKPSESSFILGFVVLASIVLFAVAVPLCRYLLRLRKQKTLFNYTESRVNEDFDDNA